MTYNLNIKYYKYLKILEGCDLHAVQKSISINKDLLAKELGLEQVSNTR